MVQALVRVSIFRLNLIMNVKYLVFCDELGGGNCKEIGNTTGIIGLKSGRLEELLNNEEKNEYKSDLEERIH